MLLNGAEINANDFNSNLNIKQQRIISIENMDMRNKFDDDTSSTQSESNKSDGQITDKLNIS